MPEVTANGNARRPPHAELVVAISSRALFDLSASNDIFENEGLEAYRAWQIAREDDVLEPGVAFPLVRKLLGLNAVLQGPRVEVVLLSRNSADTGLRVFNSIAHHRLAITRAAFCSGRSPYRYVRAFGCDLFLSLEAADVRSALNHGVAAATLLPGIGLAGDGPDDELRIAFDGDAVLFSDEAERVYQQGGLEKFSASEKLSARRPLSDGPFKPVLEGLHRLQQALPADQCSIRTALVTARSAPAHERVVRTLREWDIRLDESLFLGGQDKAEFLAAFGADMFFDDQPHNVQSASDRVAAGHVPAGVVGAGTDHCASE